jgi:hypothetical protein
MTTDLKPDIWNVLHDGTIVGATGAVPGDVQLSISIDYLLRRFPGNGQHLILTLHDCTDFAYEPDDPKGRLTNLEAISAAEPEILKAENWKDANKVYCVSGTLHVFTRAFSLALDSGRTITLQELIDVSQAYWTEWSERAQQAG